MRKILFFSAIISCLIMGNVNAQSIPDNAYGKILPYTWEMPMWGGKMISTANRDGSITTRMVTVCAICGGRGRCGVCGGTGGQIWGGVIRACMNCGGTGRCPMCRGDGVSVINTRTEPNGVTVGYDEQGRAYIAYPGERNNNNRRSDGNNECSCCSGTGRVVKTDATSFGGTHYCKECGKTVDDSHYHAPCKCCNGKGYR